MKIHLDTMGSSPLNFNKCMCGTSPQHHSSGDPEPSAAKLLFCPMMEHSTQAQNRLRKKPDMGTKLSIQFIFKMEKNNFTVYCFSLCYTIQQED